MTYESNLFTNISHLGAIFDWDGVIIDSARFHERSWERVTDSDLAEGIIIEGFPAFDPEDGIAVYAVGVKTRSSHSGSSFRPRKGGV